MCKIKVFYINFALLLSIFVEAAFAVDIEYKRIFQDNYIQGISVFGDSLAFGTDSDIIFGNLDIDLNFTETNRTKFPSNAIKKIYLMFKLINDNTVIICTKEECWFCISTFDQCSTLSVTNINQANGKEFGNKLYLRINHLNRFRGDKKTLVIYVFQFENNTYNLIGKSVDRTIPDYELIFEPFTFKNHIYFVHEVIRPDLAMEILSKNSDLNITRKNREFIITQICKNDESEDLISRMDLVLTCGDTNYSNPASKVENYLTGVHFFPENKTLLIGNQNINKDTNFYFLCKFDMDVIGEEFKKLWNFCQTATEPDKSCLDKKSYKELADQGCLKLQWRIKTSSVYPTCQKFGLDKKILENSCAAAVLNSSLFPSNKRFGWLENLEPIYGSYVRSNFRFSNFFPGKQSNEIGTMKMFSTFAKLSFDSLNYTIDGEWFTGYPPNYDQFWSPWNFNDGFLYVTSNTIYFKNTSTVKNVSRKEHKWNELLTCGACYKILFWEFCGFEKQTICGPVWWKMIQPNLTKFWDSFFDTDTVTGQKIHCERLLPHLKNRKCSKNLKIYLKPFFETLPLTKDEIEAEESNYLYLTSFLIVIVVAVLLMLALCALILRLYKKKKLSSNSNVNNDFEQTLINCNHGELKQDDESSC